MKKIYNTLLLLFMAAFCHTSVSAQPWSRLTDSLALVNLYTDTDGANWTSSHQWDLTTTIDTWYGIQIDADGRVISIDLDDNPNSHPNWGSDGGTNNMNGTLPSSLGNLSELRYLALTSNNGTLNSGRSLHGAIPATLGLTKLEQLYLQGNELSGTIPPELGQLQNLLFLYLTNNNLSGSLPTELGNLTHLIVMHISDNHLTGGIPTTWQFADMTELWLQNNQLTGGIPATMGDNYPQLEFLILYNNMLGGTIPTNLGNLHNMLYLGLYSNQLTGTIPDLSGMSSAVEIVLSYNSLTGSIPSYLGSFNNLTKLYLQNNNLSGCLSFDLHPLCRPQTTVDISTNTNLSTQDWAAFCSSNAGQCATLPIELANFEGHPLPIESGSAISKNIELTWQTASEKNNDHFDIERSRDGKNFSKIGQIKGHGTTSQVQNYGYVDTNPFSGVNYYRLKQVDIDGQSKLSKTISVEMLNETKKLGVFPNPVSDNLTVVFDKKGPDTEGVSSQLELYNLQGQLLKQQRVDLGLDETKVSMAQLPVGVYMISLRQNGQIVSSVKVTKN
jgi:Secretion system C-terminal sorting domain